MVSTGSSMMNIQTVISHTTEETLPKASTSEEAYQIGKQCKPQKQRDGSKKKVFYIEKIKKFKTCQQLKTRLLKLQNKCKDVKKSYRVAEMKPKGRKLL
ncbi:unnamed protein product [Parnassius apollo]|uniref:(apollo) hypothetical protein n=1 Tax=Parnassius apollo TaxID=110799 RepID=A0A8S3XQU8_PARAO|nr:unnamed protein product [Parnassius apollo]